MCVQMNLFTVFTVFTVFVGLIGEKSTKKNQRKVLTPHDTIESHTETVYTYIIHYIHYTTNSHKLELNAAEKSGPIQNACKRIYV